MGNSRRLDRKALTRSLLVGLVFFLVSFPYQVYLVPLYPVLDTQPLDALAAAVVGLIAWWVVFRVWRA